MVAGPCSCGGWYLGRGQCTQGVDSPQIHHFGPTKQAQMAKAAKREAKLAARAAACAAERAAERAALDKQLHEYTHGEEVSEKIESRTGTTASGSSAFSGSNELPMIRDDDVDAPVGFPFPPESPPHAEEPVAKHLEWSVPKSVQ